MKSLLSVLLSGTLAFMLPNLSGAATQTASPATVSAKVSDTKAVMRDLWVGHIFWVRDVVAARLAENQSQAKSAEQQVVANAQAIAGAIEPFYGKAASDQLFKLLAGHWGAISDYLNAARDSQKSGQDAAYTKLVDNAGQIATFLGGANPNLPVDTLRSLLTAHGAQHVQQIQQLKAGQYDQEAKTWDEMKNHIYMVSDALVDGIAKQFPQKF